MIREHGPANSTQKLCLFVVNSFMNDSGVSWPSQSSIARAASLAENTVQRALARVINAGWLGAETRLTKGKAWKRYIYRTAVPDALVTSEIMQTDSNLKLVESFEAMHGPLPKWGRPLKRDRNKREGPLSEAEGPHPGWSEGPHSKIECPHLNAAKVPIQGGTKFS